MNRNILSLLALTIASTVLSAAGTAAPATAAESAAAPQTAKQALAEQQAARPGKVVGNEIHYPGGEVFVAQDAGTFSLSQCSSGWFCLWTFSNYSGSFTYKTGSGVTRTISTSVGSFYNHRSTAARLYSNTGASSICYGPEVQQPSVSSSYNSASQVYLSSTSSC